MRGPSSLRIAALVCLLAAAGCGATPSDPRTSPGTTAAPASTVAVPGTSDAGAGNLASLVVTPEDLALVGDVEYLQFDEGSQGRSDVLPPPRDDPARFGRVAGWKARYRPEDPSAEKGFIVGSRVDAFQTPEGATSELGLIGDDAQARAATGAVRLLETDKVGEASVALTYEHAAVGGNVVYFEYHWRSGRYAASVELSGFEGQLSIDDAVLLARAVQARIEAAPD